MNDSEIRLLRRKEVEAREMAQRVALLKMMISDFDKVIADLDGQIAAEEERTRIKDTRHPLYSTFATAAAKRRQNLLISTAQTKSLLEVAKRELDEVAMQSRERGIQNHQPPPPSPASTPEEIFAAGSVQASSGG